jgi:hypothetical protein
MSDERTVYVVMSGYYSDKSVEAVFSTEEAAKRYCDIRNKTASYSSEFHYDDYILDPLDRIADGRLWHRVEFDPDGTVGEVVAGDEDGKYFPAEVVWVSARTASGKAWLRVWVEARDPEHAVKIASEKRAEYLAQQAGIS